MSSYLVQEEDGTSRFTLEDGSGALLLEDGTVAPPAPVQTVAVGGGPQRPVPPLRRRDLRFLVPPGRVFVQATEPRFAVRVNPVAIRVRIRQQAASTQVLLSAIPAHGTFQLRNPAQPKPQITVRLNATPSLLSSHIREQQLNRAQLALVIALAAQRARP